MASAPPPEPPNADEARLRTAQASSSPAADGGLSANVVGVIKSPVVQFRAISRDQPVGQAIAVIAVVVFLLAAAQVIGLGSDPQALPRFALAGLLGALVIGVPIAIVSFLVWVAAVLLFAKMLGGSGSFAGTFCGLGFAYLPMALGAVAAVATIPLGMAASGAVTALAVLSTAVWSLVLDVIAVREVHRFSTGRAVGAVLLPVVLLFVLSVLLLAGFLAAVFVAV